MVHSNILDDLARSIEKGIWSSERIQEVVLNASNPRKRVWENAVYTLRELSEKWSVATNAILAMSKDAKANVRFAAICSLGTKTPIAITDEILKASLVDKSHRVRWKAAQCARELRRVNLVPEIAAALLNESNTSTQSSIEFDLRLLRDGYWISPNSANSSSFNLYIPTDRGWAGKIVSSEELSLKGIDLILAEFRQR